MAKLYLIRHAESQANTRGVYQGQSYDTDLSDLGQRQAAALANRFADQPVDAIYSSHLKRTRQTAVGLGHALDEPALLETNHGAWEGLSKVDIQATWPDLYATWLAAPSQVAFPGGESYTETQNRIVTWFDKVRATDRTIIAVTHSNIIMSLLTHIASESLDNIWRYVMQPTAVTLVESHSPAKIIYLNDTTHLRGLESDLSLHAL